MGVPATIIWIVALMNMVNFLDGLDGLAAGVCGISGATFAVIALSLGKPSAAILSAIVCGACIGFLRHNFYPARIFMGDSGALLLGFVLATLSVQGLLKTAATVALFFPLIVLAIPIIDTSFVVARRIKNREKLYAPDGGSPAGRTGGRDGAGRRTGELIRGAAAPPGEPVVFGCEWVAAGVSLFCSQVTPIAPPTTRAAPTARAATRGGRWWPVVMVVMSWSFVLGPAPPASLTTHVATETCPPHQANSYPLA